jgi:CRISPR/Cas system-associated exonuclease Cas4 (RecB family)
MGTEFEVNSLEDMCNAMCNNVLPKNHKQTKPKNTKFLFDEKQTSKGMVSVSQIQTFLSCRNKWKYNYIDNLTPRMERSYLTIGKLCHKGMQAVMQMLWRFPSSTLEQLTQHGLEAMYNMGEEYMGNTPMLDEEIPDFLQMRADALAIFAQALREFDPLKYEVVTVIKDGKEIPALELHFKVPCAPTKGLHGYIDAILRNKETGFTWCVDYKFRKSLAPDEDEMFNIQNSVYSYACQKMGIEITGTKTWQHVNVPAADPQILKTGAISRAKIKTTWEHYAEFCQQNGENPDNYQEEMEEKLSDIEWYRETHEYRNPETIHNIWNTCVIPVAKEIVKANGKNVNNFRSLYPWNCKMCQYQSLCQAELRNYDAQAIRDREYTKREHIENTLPLASVALEED